MQRHWPHRRLALPDKRNQASHHEALGTVTHKIEEQDTMTMQRRTFVAGGAALLAAPGFLAAQALEQPKLTLAVGGKNLLYYLPLTIAETQGYFKAEGLEVNIVDFAGGSQALRAVVGGSADGDSGRLQ